jgi:heptosyltransferase-2
LQNAFEAALVAWLARIPRRIGYSRDARAPLLTDRIPVPKKGEIHAHERYYYLELLRRAGMIDRMPDAVTISLAGAGEARATGLVRLHAVGLPERVIGISPGAANSRAKQWGPERFAEAAHTLAGSADVGIALFGSAGERELCEAMRAQLSRFHPAVNFAGRTRLAEFIETAAACHVFLTNDSGAMHVAAAVGTPTVAVFGPTDAVATGPSGPRCRVVREPVSCSPCLLRDCPIDHRCMTRVTTASVVEAARDLVGCTAQFRKVT